MLASNTQNVKKRISRLIVIVLVILAGILLWFGGPRRISRVVPKDVVSCQILYVNITDVTAEDSSRRILFEREKTAELIDFLNQYDLKPIWEIGSGNVYMDFRYTFLFYDESVLRAQISVTDRGEVEIGTRKYRFSNWTSGDAAHLNDLIM